MNLGLGNLNDLKRDILPSGMQSSTESDALLQQLGLGVSNAFEGYCNRHFARMVNATRVVAGTAAFVVVDRYPIEQIAKVELRSSFDAGWVEVANAIANLDESCGLLEFNAPLADASASVRITYTGGYWFDVSEDYSGSKPLQAAPLPDTIRTAWILQTQAFFEAMGGLLRDAERQAPKLNELLPTVREMLNPYRRLA